MGPQSLQTNLCAAPVAALDVVTTQIPHKRHTNTDKHTKQKRRSENKRNRPNKFTTTNSCSSRDDIVQHAQNRATNRMVLSVFKRNHWGTGRFWRIFLARVRLVRKDFWDGMVLLKGDFTKIPGLGGHKTQEKQHRKRKTLGIINMKCWLSLSPPLPLSLSVVPRQSKFATMPLFQERHAPHSRGSDPALL